MKDFFSVFNIIMGLGIYGMWVRYIVLGKSKGFFFSWRSDGIIMWPHIIVEFLMAGSLILSGVGMRYFSVWPDILAIFALGSLFYSSFTSLSWAISEKKRWPYFPFILIAVVGSLALIMAVLLRLKF